MSSSAFITIDGRRYRWKDILELRRAQLTAANAVQARQLVLFEALCDDHRPVNARTASGRYEQPSLLEMGM